MEKLVLDTSVTGMWLLPDESSDLGDKLFAHIEAGKYQTFAPALWWTECGNLIRSNVMRKRIDIKRLSEVLQVLYELPISLEPTPTQAIHRSILDLALKHDLTFYDATYLELAIRKKTVLATFDKAIRRAAAAYGIGCLELG